MTWKRGARSWESHAATPAGCESGPRRSTNAVVDSDALGRFPEEGQVRAQKNREQLNRVVYAEIGRLAAQYSARKVILRLSHPLEADWQKLKELSPGAIVVNAQAMLDAQVPSRNRDDYYRLFGHGRGSPPRLVDTHPNPAAHRVIADAVVSAIKADARRNAAGRVDGGG